MPVNTKFADLVKHLFLKNLGRMPAPKVEANKKLIACIGDSVTFGAGVRENRDQTWEHYLNELLGDDFQVLNYGINARTLQNEGDYPYTADKYYKISQDVKADTYLIMLGTNDAKPYNWNEKRFENELLFFVRSYTDLPHKPRVILMTPPQCYPDPQTGIVGFDIDPANIDDHIVGMVKKIGSQLKLEVIDLHEHTQNHPEWFVDGVHPNDLGNLKLAEKIIECFR